MTGDNVPNKLLSGPEASTKKMQLKLKPETKKELEEAATLFTVYFLMFSTVWLVFAITGRGSKGLDNFMWWVVINAAIWSIGVSATSMAIKTSADNYKKLSEREKRYYWQNILHYLYLFIAGAIIAGAFIFVFDIKLSQRVIDSQLINALLNNPFYCVLLGGITAIYADITSKALNNHRRWH